MKRLYWTLSFALVLLAVVLSTSSWYSSENPEVTVHIDPGVRYQTIEGFGANLVDSGGFYGLLEPTGLLLTSNSPGLMG